MDYRTKKQILIRINYLTGHLKGVAKMIDADQYCVDIINQNQGVVAAINQVNKLILKNHLETCVTRAIEGRKKNQKQKVFKELVEIFKVAG